MVLGLWEERWLLSKFAKQSYVPSLSLLHQFLPFSPRYPGKFGCPGFDITLPHTFSAPPPPLSYPQFSILDQNDLSLLSFSPLFPPWKITNIQIHELIAIIRKKAIQLNLFPVSGECLKLPTLLHWCCLEKDCCWKRNPSERYILLGYLRKVGRSASFCPAGVLEMRARTWGPEGSF